MQLKRRYALQKKTTSKFILVTVRTKGSQEGPKYNRLDNYIQNHENNQTVSFSNKNKLRNNHKIVQRNRDTKF